jgi:hypothetical protein
MQGLEGGATIESGPTVPFNSPPLRAEQFGDLAPATARRADP